MCVIEDTVICYRTSFHNRLRETEIEDNTSENQQCFRVGGENGEGL